jgi:hypothetical protein
MARRKYSRLSGAYKVFYDFDVFGNKGKVSLLEIFK